MAEIWITTTDNIRLSATYNRIPHSQKIIIFAHGMTVDRFDEDIFLDAAEELEQLGFSSILFDFRAHGKSEGDSIKDFTVSNELADLSAIFDFVKKEGFTWIGLAGASFGGSIASLYAGRHPNQVQKLFLANPVLNYQVCFLKPITPWGIQYFSDPLRQFKENGYIDLGQRHYKIGPALIEEMEKFHPESILLKYTSSIMIIHGDKDEKIPLEQAQDAFNKLTNFSKTFEVIKGSDHGFHEKPYESIVAKKIVQFFATK